MTRFIFVALILLTVSCSKQETPQPQAEQPAAQTLPQYTFTITSQQNGKDVVNGKLIIGDAIITDSSKPDFKETANLVLHDIVNKNVGTEWIIVRFAESREKAEANVYSASGTYKEGHFELEVKQKGQTGYPEPSVADYELYREIKRIDEQAGHLPMKTIYKRVAENKNTTTERVAQAYDNVTGYENNLPK